MALGLVQPRPGDVSRSNQDLTYSPRHARRHRTQSFSKIQENLLAPKSKVKILVDIVLNTPVLVMPRSSCSPQVLVAHLGKITISNRIKVYDTSLLNDTLTSLNEDLLNLSCNDDNFRSDENIFDIEDMDETIKDLSEDESNLNYDIYSIDIRNMNLYSLDTTSRKGFRMSALPRAEEFYSCQTEAIAILHDTAIRLEICRKTELYGYNFESAATSFISLTEGSNNINNEEKMDQLIISGSIINPLRLSLKRIQYEQLLDTIENAFKVPSDLIRPPTEASKMSKIDERNETDEINPLNFDNNEKIKKVLFSQASMERKTSPEMLVKVMFSLPVFIIQLNHENSAVVEMCFRDFNVDYEQVNQWETHLQVSLRSVVMEDLLLPMESKHRIMVSSSNEEPQRLTTPFLSNSCPDLTDLGQFSCPLSSSLPNNLEPNVGFQQFLRQQKIKKVGFINVSNNCPGTPPPSPQAKSREDNLVIYSSIIVDPTCPQFESKYKSRRAKSSIDFNCLSLNVSVESWFVLLNFFGVLSDDNEPVMTRSSTSATTEDPGSLKGTSELDISVRSLNLTLVKPEYELAKTNVSNARFIVTKVGHSKNIEGSLGSISLNDLTTHGSIYREKFMTSGNEALNFTYIREHAKSPFNKRSLEKDAQLNIKMSSVRYVHTKRFVMEIQTFFNDLFKLQAPVMRKMKGEQRQPEHRPTQLGLDISAESPLILLPLSSRSEKLIVANLGELSITNIFKMSNDRDTVSERKEKRGPIEMLDVMMIDLLHTNLYAGYRKSKCDDSRLEDLEDFLDMGTYLLYKDGSGFLKDKCHLKLRIERNLDSWKSHNVDDISVHGILSKLEAELDLQQYKLIRGFLAFNLGEEIDDVFESSVLNNIYDSSLSLNSSFIANDAEHSSWNSLSMKFDLHDVSLKLKQDNTSLACINFIKSTLKVESKNDGSQDIDLISQEILITDTRNCDENVFVNILKPMTNRELKIQAEIHSRRRQDNTQFTIMLNNMRLMMIMDWLESSRDFILQNEEQPALISIANKKEIQPVGTFELKLNITDSELVLVESPDRLDSNALILKSTTVLNYRPQEINRTMSINLDNLEVFSCLLNSEESTALSIIDPVTINMDVRKGILVIHLLKQLLIRLSYHDFKMFQRMLHSLPQQTRHARNKRSNSVAQENDFKSLRKLQALGFRAEDCKLALEVSDNQLDEAALWLTQNVEPLKSPSSKRNVPESAATINHIEVKANRISINIIDDCKDADVPLLELSLTHLDLAQDIRPAQSGFAVNLREGHLKTIFASDYFNRALSGYEPVVEPWKCEANWTYSLSNPPLQQSRLSLKMKSNEVLRLNLTSTLMDIYQTVHENWTQDYYAATSTSNVARRSPFVPFAIKNETGCRLYFSTFTVSPGTSLTYSDIAKATKEDWLVVEHGENVPFTFARIQTKLRHIDSHKMNLHQIAVRVEGWAPVGPISIDKVGSFFRHAGPEFDEPYSTSPRARIVFHVSLEGSAQKLVTVRSALKFVNKLDHPVLMKMEHLFGHLNIRNWPSARSVLVNANEKYSVPLSHVHANLYVKPLPVNFKLEDFSVDSSISSSSSLIDRIDGKEYWNRYGKFCDGGTIGNFQFNEKCIHWKDVQDPLETHQEVRTCYSISSQMYKLVFAIKREPFPTKDNFLSPAHEVTLWPPLRLHNFLPVDLLFKLQTGYQGRISSSNTVNIHEVDLDQMVEIAITLDSFPGAGTIFLNPYSAPGSEEQQIRLTDIRGRILMLKAFIQVIRGSGMQISIFAPFWLVNRTGLPLVFKQEGVVNDFAGQFSENEQGRLVSPLMFSFSDPDSSMALTCRLGKRYGQNLSYCQPFSFHKDVLHRQLKSNVTNETFVIGIEVRGGRGRYTHTNIVTFSPRFQLYNRSSYKLQFAQKCFATVITDPQAQSTFIEAVPGCHLPFHFPKLEKPQELCVRLPDVEECLWSGGIPINETQSIYVNIRDINGNMHFLRLEIVLQGATYFLLFGNAEVLPPPIRIDNYSEVPIKFFQSNCRNMTKTTVKPHSSMAYVLDEVNGSQSICIEAPGGDTCKCPLFDFDSGRLTYENFIYIAFTQTFENVSNFTSDDEYDVKAQQLVLGVEGNRVVLMKKKAGDRAQLWRMNNEKQLEHEGSSPPSEPGKKSQRFVLDLEKPPQPMQQNQLIVRPANYQRRSTQTWRFTEEGRLMCEHTNMCVQSRDGFFGLKNGSDAVLGLIVRETKAINNVGVPFEQAIERQKLRPGSGCLEVSFRMDGPIKTLQIKDIKQRSDLSLAVDPHWRHVSHIRPNSITHLAEDAAQALSRKKSESFIDEFHINWKLTKGLGLSLVSRLPCEELAYISFEDIHTEIINTPSIKSLDLSVRDVQIDNQLFETTCPIFLCTVKNSADELVEEKLPALQINGKMLSSPNKNAIIFEVS